MPNISGFFALGIRTGFWSGGWGGGTGGVCGERQALKRPSTPNPLPLNQTHYSNSILSGFIVFGVFLFVCFEVPVAPLNTPSFRQEFLHSVLHLLLFALPCQIHPP